MKNWQRDLLLQAGRRKPPKVFLNGLMNRVNTAYQKTGLHRKPRSLDRKVWIANAHLCCVWLVLAGFLGDRTFTMNDVVPAFIKEYAQKLRSFTIPLPEFPVWPVFLSMVALLGYCVEDFLIRRYLRKKQ
jgi:hypothetical protein